MNARPWPTVGADGDVVDPPWELRGEGRAWREGEAWKRYRLTPHKIEMVGGKLLNCEEDRELLLGLLLENVGADRAVRFGDPKVWREAVTRISGEDSSNGQPSPRPR